MTQATQNKTNIKMTETSELIKGGRTKIYRKESNKTSIIRDGSSADSSQTNNARSAYFTERYEEQ